MLTRVSFTEHPRQVGESYLEHLGVAAAFGGQMIVGGIACLIHGVLPFLCTTSGSRTIASLHRRMVMGRRRRNVGRNAAAGS